MKERLAAALPARGYLHLLRTHLKVTNNKRYRDYQNRRIITTHDNYSFKPFDDTKSIFVHVPKCAGISVASALYGNRAGGHTTLDEYARIFEPSLVLKYFKFAIVRNPWDRLVSAFHFLKAGGMNEADRRWAERELAEYDTFDKFIQCWLKKENIWRSHHFRPQHYYLLESRRKLKLDFIGFLENIEDDFAYITKRLKSDAKLPKHNGSQHRRYSDYYSPATRQLVAETYPRDLKLLGYSFDNSSLEFQLSRRRTT